MAATPNTGIPFEGLFTITGTGNSQKLKASTKLKLTGPDDTQSITIHTSCSKALSCGDQFGSLKVVELVSSLGGTVNCENPELPGQEGTMCEVEGSPAGTNCTTKPVEIVFEYTGSDCQESAAPGSGQGWSATATCRALNRYRWPTWARIRAISSHHRPPGRW